MTASGYVTGFCPQLPEGADDAFLAQVLSEHTEIAALDLHSTQVTAAGLSRIRGRSDLISLRLSSEKMSDEACAIAATLPSLEVLWLFGQGFTDRALSLLDTGLPSIQIVYLVGTSVSSVEAERFRISRPGIMLLHLSSQGRTPD